MGEDCPARIAKSEGSQPRYFCLWGEFGVRKMSKQDSRGGISCFTCKSLEKWRCVALFHFRALEVCGNFHSLWLQPQLFWKLMFQFMWWPMGASAQRWISITKQILLFDLLFLLRKKGCKVKREKNRSENIHIACIYVICCWFRVPILGMHMCEQAVAAEQWKSHSSSWRKHSFFRILVP